MLQRLVRRLKRCGHTRPSVFDSIIQDDECKKLHSMGLYNIHARLLKLGHRSKENRPICAYILYYILSKRHGGAINYNLLQKSHVEVLYWLHDEDERVRLIENCWEVI